MLSRRGFRTLTKVIHLPWQALDVEFTDACTRCGNCLTACPEHIIVKGSGGFPQIDFKLGECTFCAACVEACEVPVLFDRQRVAFHHTVNINDQCLPHRGIACQSCADVCEPNAIQFRWNDRRLREPAIDNNLCNRCGACVAVCPSDAISLSFTTEQVTT